MARCVDAVKKLSSLMLVTVVFIIWLFLFCFKVRLSTRMDLHQTFFDEWDLEGSSWLFRSSWRDPVRAAPQKETATWLFLVSFLSGGAQGGHGVPRGPAGQTGSSTHELLENSSTKNP